MVKMKRENMWQNFPGKLFSNMQFLLIVQKYVHSAMV